MSRDPALSSSEFQEFAKWLYTVLFVVYFLVFLLSGLIDTQFLNSLFDWWISVVPAFERRLDYLRSQGDRSASSYLGTVVTFVPLVLVGAAVNCFAYLRAISRLGEVSSISRRSLLSVVVACLAFGFVILAIFSYAPLDGDWQVSRLNLLFLWPIFPFLAACAAVGAMLAVSALFNSTIRLIFGGR